MQCDTNHLVSLEDMNDLEKETLQLAGYEPVPDRLSTASLLALGIEKSVYISRTSGGKLSKHAAAKRKAKRKAEKKARYNSRK